MRYIKRLIWTLVFLFVVVLLSHCEAAVNLGQKGYIEYTLNTDSYEVIYPNDYYMYIQTRNIETNDICILHIRTVREENVYIVTDGIVKFNGGKIQSFSKWDKGKYNETSIIDVAINTLDSIEEGEGL